MRRPTDRCAAKGCGHMRSEHHADFCRVCFDIHPSDDSEVEGGVYHEFDEGVI